MTRHTPDNLGVKNPGKEASFPENYGKKGSMRWIYLSPHLDDVIWSCGGLIWEQRQQGVQVSIWTIFSGDPPDGELSLFAQFLHQRWGIQENSVRQRRSEDELACAYLDAECYHFMFPDCIYRKAPVGSAPPSSTTHVQEGGFLYPTREAIFSNLHPSEERFAEEISRRFSQHIKEGDILVSPLVLGNHVDHQLTRMAAEACGKVAWYYADFPYVQDEAEDTLRALRERGWREHCFPISEAGLEAWQEAAAQYTSQIGIFWEGIEHMRREIAAYREQNAGILLWKAP